VYDLDWRWVYTNDAAAAWLRSRGKQPAQLIGRCVWDEFDESRSDPSYEAALRAIRENREILHETRIADRFFETRIIPYATGIFSLTRDVTERKIQELRNQILAETSSLFASALTQEQVMASLVERARAGFGAFAAGLAAKSADGTSMEIVYEADWPVAGPRSAPLSTRTLTAEATRTGEIAHVSSPAEFAARFPEVNAAFGTLGASAATAIPLKSGGEVLGALVLLFDKAHPLSQEELQFMRALAQPAALAMERTRLQEAVQWRARQHSAVALLGISALAGKDLDVLLYDAVEALCTALDVELSKVMESLPDGSLRLRAGLGWREGLVGSAVMAPADSQAGYALGSSAPVIVEHLPTDPRFRDAPLLREHGVVSGMSVIIHGPENAWGVLGAHSTRRRTFTSDEIAFLQSVANVIAQKIIHEHTKADLVAAKEAAETASTAKSQFLGVMSHELRTPLNSVIGYSDLLLMEASGPLNEDQKRHVSRIQASARHQHMLIEELLAYTRLEAGREELRIISTDLRRIVIDVAEFVRPDAERKNVNLILDLPDDALAAQTDPAKVRQVVLNLAGNAVKFTESGAITLRAWSAPAGFFIEVRDTGPGIPDHMLQSIFEPFVQADQDHKHHVAGTGLGLAIAQRYTSLLRGELHVESKVGVGTSFVLRLPFPLPPDPQA
jgi:signal transduction histidine kinase